MRKIAKVKITLWRHTISFITEAMKWLEVYFDTKLQFLGNNYLKLKKAKKVEERVGYLKATRELALGQIKRIQVATV